MELGAPISDEHATNLFGDPAEGGVRSLIVARPRPNSTRSAHSSGRMFQESVRGVVVIFGYAASVWLLSVVVRSLPCRRPTQSGLGLELLPGRAAVFSFSVTTTPATTIKRPTADAMVNLCAQYQRSQMVPSVCELVGPTWWPAACC